MAMNTLLDPTLDVVFKLLFADDRNRELLSALLTAVLEPPAPITDVEVLNPETPRETVIEKGAVLDVRARLADGTQTHVEMQAAPHPGLRQRVLYYWARLYTSQLVRGDHYVELAPTVGVFLLSFVELPTTRFHSVFRLMEAEEQVVLADDLVIHVLELPKRPRGAPAAGEPAVLHWCRFFAAQSELELEQLATMDPNLRRAASRAQAGSVELRARPATRTPRRPRGGPRGRPRGGGAGPASEAHAPKVRRAAPGRRGPARARQRAGACTVGGAASNGQLHRRDALVADGGAST
jgi:predicted transposase/invertase (TIGR01784 family)